MYINSGLLRATVVVGYSFKFKGKGSIYGEVSVSKIELCVRQIRPGASLKRKDHPTNSYNRIQTIY